MGATEQYLTNLYRLDLGEGIGISCLYMTPGIWIHYVTQVSNVALGPRVSVYFILKEIQMCLLFKQKSINIL